MAEKAGIVGAKPAIMGTADNQRVAEVLRGQLADIGVDPRRVRAWPNQLEISALFVGARPAPEELIAAAGPEYTAEDVRALLGERGPELHNLWLAWEAIRPALLAEDEPQPVAEVERSSFAH